MIVGTLVIVAGIEIAFHWLLGRADFPALLGVYLARGASGKAFNAFMVDNLIPAALVGWTCGWVGYSRWSPRALVGITVGIAIFVAGLMPVYRVLIGPDHFSIVWGATKSHGELVSSHLYDVFTAFLSAGAFAHGGYVFRRDWKRSKS